MFRSDGFKAGEVASGSFQLAAAVVRHVFSCHHRGFLSGVSDEEKGGNLCIEEVSVDFDLATTFF